MIPLRSFQRMLAFWLASFVFFGPTILSASSLRLDPHTRVTVNFQTQALSLPDRFGTHLIAPSHKLFQGTRLPVAAPATAAIHSEQLWHLPRFGEDPAEISPDIRVFIDGLTPPAQTALRGLLSARVIPSFSSWSLSSVLGLFQNELKRFSPGPNISLTDRILNSASRGLLPSKELPSGGFHSRTDTVPSSLWRISGAWVRGPSTVRSALYGDGFTVIPVLLERPEQSISELFVEKAETLSARALHSVVYVVRGEEIEKRIIADGYLKWVPIEAIKAILCPTKLAGPVLNAFVGQWDKIINVDNRLADIHLAYREIRYFDGGMDYDSEEIVLGEYKKDLKLLIPDYESALVNLAEGAPERLLWIHGMRLPLGGGALHIVGEGCEAAFSEILAGRSADELIEAISQYVMLLNPVTDLSPAETATVRALQKAMRQELGEPFGKLMVEVVDDPALIPNLDNGFLGVLYLPTTSLKPLFRVHRLLIQQLIREPLFVQHIAWHERIEQVGILAGLSVRAAHLGAMEKDPSLEPFIRRILRVSGGSPPSPIITDQYIPGVGLQKSVRNDPRGVEEYILSNFVYGCLGFAEQEIEVRGHYGDPGSGWDIHSDRWYEEFATGADPHQKVLYQAAVRHLFKEQDRRAEMTTEQFYAALIELRRRYFPAEYDHNQRQLESALRRSGHSVAVLFDQIPSQFGTLRTAILTSIFADYGNNIYEQVMGEPRQTFSMRKLEDWLRYPRPVSDIDDFARRLQAPTTYVHVAGSVNSLAADLKVFGEMLLRLWAGSGKVVFAVKAERVGSDACLADVEALLRQKEFQALRADPRFSVIVTGGRLPGTDFRHVSPEFRMYLHQVQEGVAILGLKGEMNNLTSNGLLLGHFRLYLTRDIETRRLTGIFWDENEQEAPTPVVLRVPAGIAPYDRFHKGLTVFQFVKARERFEQGRSSDALAQAYEKVRTLLAQTGESFVEAIHPEVLLWPVRYKKLHDEYERLANKVLHPTLLMYAQARRQQLFDERAREVFGGENYISQIYSLKGDGTDPERTEVFPGPNRFENQKNVLVNGVLVDPTKWGLDMIQASEIAKGYREGQRSLISHDRVFSDHPGASLTFNGLYFFTSNVLHEYNRLRHERPSEILHEANFYIDAFLRPGGDKGGIENAPLYNKGYFGIGPSGRLVFGRRRLLGGTVRLPSWGTSIQWTSGDVIDSPDRLKAPGLASRPVLVYTPMISEDISFADPDYKMRSTPANGYSVPVGAGRVNLIVVDNAITAIMRGDVLMPSVGIVVSLSESQYRKTFLSGRWVGTKDGLPPVEFEFEWPAGSERPYWYFGGGTLLYQNGVNLVDDRAAEEKNFREEGWFKLLSCQTQETQLQDWVRGPRAVIGRTVSGQMFIFTFSGRSSYYAGANFAEMMAIVEQEMKQRGESVQDALNLDGGSSVAMVLRGKDHQIYTLNWPAIGPTSMEGYVRSISSIGLLSRKGLEVRPGVHRLKMEV